MSDLPGTLFIIATPIGNLEDLTLRALRVLGEADLIAAEDTRHTRKLLSHFEIKTPLISFHEHSDTARLDHLVQQLLAGQSVALVTDAGTPGVSDPGVELVQAALSAAIPVVPLPGASAVLTALVGSGLPLARFAFEGFLPRTKSALREKLGALRHDSRTLIFYEAPSRTLATLTEMAAIFGSARPAAVGRELTKKHEEFIRGPLSDILAHFTAHPPRGEITIVIGSGDMEEAPAEAAVVEISLEDALKSALASGMTERDAVRQVAAKMQLGRREVYAAMLGMKGGEE